MNLRVSHLHPKHSEHCESSGQPALLPLSGKGSSLSICGPSVVVLCLVRLWACCRGLINVVCRRLTLWIFSISLSCELNRAPLMLRPLTLLKCFVFVFLVFVCSCVRGLDLPCRARLLPLCPAGKVPISNSPWGCVSSSFNRPTAHCRKHCACSYCKQLDRFFLRVFHSHLKGLSGCSTCVCILQLAFSHYSS